MKLPSLWMKTLCSGDLAAVLSLYAEGAVLVSTYGRNVLVGKREIAHYLRFFMAKPGLCGTIDAKTTQTIDEVTVYSGNYTFVWTGGGVGARFTFVVVDGVIVNQHSSEEPT